MTNKWVIWLAVAGFAYVAGDQCDSANARACFEDLLNYETIMFPLYGNNEAKLDDNCGNINVSLDCIQTFVENCHNTTECDEHCIRLIREMNVVMRSTGLITLADNLCDKENALRHSYLENAECLEETAEFYALCHNTSQESQDYMATTKGANTVEARCCYLSWFRDCFTNTTREKCGENATIVVSIAEHYLQGHIAASHCSNVSVVCDKPPLPSDETMTDNEIDTSGPGDKKQDKNKSDDIDDNSAAKTLYSSIVLFLPCVFSLLFSYVL